MAHFKPYVKEHEIDGEVTKFEESVLFFSDAYKLYGPGSKLRILSGQSPIDQTLVEKLSDSISRSRVLLVLRY